MTYTPSIQLEHNIRLKITVTITYIYVTYALAYSMFSKMYQYYLHSTNHNKNFDQQNALFLPLNLKMNEISNRKNRAK